MSWWRGSQALGWEQAWHCLILEVKGCSRVPDSPWPFLLASRNEMVNTGKKVTGKRKGQVPEDANVPGRYCPGAAEDISSADMTMEITVLKDIYIFSFICSFSR